MPKSVLESDIEKATSEYNVSEDWQIIMDITDKVKTGQATSKDVLKYVMKRVHNPVPHVSMQALTLLAACVDNCDKPFHLEICSREWTNDAKTVITRGHEKVSKKIRELIQKWAEDFKDDPQLHMMVKFYKQLKSDGFGFDSTASSSNAMGATSSTNKSSNNDELSFKEDLDLAIAMSLQEAETPKNNPPAANNIYPGLSSEPLPFQMQEREIFKVRALYDFEAAEDNEMTFKSGEIFSVLDNSDENWWKGQNCNGIGLFPANFVTTELVEEPPAEKKKVRFADAESTGEKSAASKAPIVKEVTLNEEHLDLTLSMLKNASPNEIDDEEETICSMEDMSMRMRSLIEKKILLCENKKDDLSELNDKYLQALAMYQQFMQEPRTVQPPAQPIAVGGVPSYASPQHSIAQQYQRYPVSQPPYGVTYNADPYAASVDPSQVSATSYANTTGLPGYSQHNDYTTSPPSLQSTDSQYQSLQNYSYDYTDPNTVATQPAAYMQQSYPNEQYYATDSTVGSYYGYQDYSASQSSYPPPHQTSVYQ